MKDVIGTWETIKERVLEHLEGTEVLSLIAHGSFAEGLANENSDFDLLVICGENVKEKTEIMKFGNMEVDIDFLHEKTLKDQLKSLDNLLESGSLPPFASRLKNAVVLSDSNDIGKNLVDMARAYQPSFELMDMYSRVAMGYYYDAVGALVSGNYTTAVHTARLAALEVLAGIMLQQGQLYVNRKWLVELMNKISAPQELFLKLMGLDTVDKEKAQECIRDLNKLIAEFQKLRKTK